MVNLRFVPSNQTTTKQFFVTYVWTQQLFEIKPPTNADHVHWDFGRPNEQTRATHENSQDKSLTLEMCNTFTHSNTITLQFSKTSFP